MKGTESSHRNCSASSTLNTLHQMEHLLQSMNLHWQTQHNPPKSVAVIRVPSWCCTFCGFGQMFTDVYPSLQHHRVFSLPLKSSVLHLFIPPSPTSELFTVSTALPFLECHIAEMIQHVAFSDWLLSLSHMPLTFFHVFSWLITCFFLGLNSVPLSGCTSLSIHLLKAILVASERPFTNTDASFHSTAWLSSCPHPQPLPGCSHTGLQPPPHPLLSAWDDPHPLAGQRSSSFNPHRLP